jgi:hypothetical protein
MATRMQQRRGTAAQWTAANPILAAGEIGFETDTSKFKMGNGSSTWSALQYFANAAELAAIVDGAPDLLNTLNELAYSIGDDPAFLTTMNTAITATGTALSTHETDQTNIHGIANTALLATQSYADSSVTTHSNDSTSIHGIADTSLLATTANIESHREDTTDVHGITDTALLARLTDITNHASVTTSVHGIANTALLAEMQDITDHAAVTLNVHGIADAAALSTKTYAEGVATTAKSEAITAAGTAADTKISDHNADTTNVHGIEDTAALATKTYADGAVTTAVAALTKSSVGLANVDNTSDANKPVSTATQTALDLKSPLASPTFTGTVSGITSTMVGLGSVDNTSDANKPVSTATQTALDLKANLSAPTFTGTVTSTNDVVVNGNLTVNGTTFNASATSITIEDNMLQLAHQNAANTVDLGLVVGYNDGANKHAGLVRDVSDAKWKLFKGVTTEPSTTVDFTEGSLDDLKVAAFEATTVTPSAGIVFSDGTQTKVGVPSITAFGSSFAATGTLAAGEQDKFIPVAGTVVITLPASGYSTGQSIDFYQASGTGASFAATNSVVGTPGLKFRTTNSVVTAMKTAAGWLVFGDLSA